MTFVGKCGKNLQVIFYDNMIENKEEEKIFDHIGDIIFEYLVLEVFGGVK